MTEPQLCSDPGCGCCAQARATAAFRGEAKKEEAVLTTCPQCSHQFVVTEQQPVRMTEAAKKSSSGPDHMPYGDVEYADPGYQKDKVKRYALNTKKRVTAAWSYINQGSNAKFYNAKQLQLIKARIKAAAKKFGITIADQAAEAFIDGQLSYADTESLVRAALQARISVVPEDRYAYVCIADMTAGDVVYSVDSGTDYELFQCTWSVSTGQDGMTVTLGDPIQVVRTYAPATADTDPDGDMDEDVAEQVAADGVLAAADDPDAAAQAADEQQATEARDRIAGRVVEAKGVDAAGNRIFRVRVIAYGDSKNARRYPEAVLREATSLYNGAKAFDHHRTPGELSTSTISGLVGYYRGAEAEQDGVYADLHVLPSMVHVAEALDATLAAQQDGLPPLVGISHDVMATYRPLVAGGQRLQEATAIVSVNSADIVANPAAGGQVTRMVAAETEPGDTTTDDPAGTVPDGESTKETDVAPTKADVLAALKTATPEELSAVGLSKATESVTGTEQEQAPAGEPKSSFMGKMMIRAKVEDAGLPVAVVESLAQALPERITESDVDAQVAALKASLGVAERAGLVPQHAVVTQEARQKKVDALDAFFAGDYTKGYHSFKEAFIDFTGTRPGAFGEDFNRVVLRESFGGVQGGYDSALRATEAQRSTESMDSTSWNLVLGDSITRRLVAEYNQPSLQNWRQICTVAPINDFRTQRIERIGGYGVLPIVNQGAPYQPLTSPTNEEATYAVAKRGGTEDVTLEMIANDDIRAIQRIPTKLGLAAAQTLYRFVWDTFPTNAAVSYDSTALFHTNHANTDTNALSQSNLSVGRQKMRDQSAYGDSKNVLSIVPRTLIVPSALEELAFQLCTSAVAIPATPAGPTNTPNIHQGLNYLTIDYFTSATGWFLVADPSMVPTIEVGFYQGRQDPELFTQADPSVGSVFNSDKITYKIRHIYSGTVLDHRGLYRGNA